MSIKKICALLMIIPALGHAKIADFNELISENAQSQKQLHTEVKSQIQEARQTVSGDSTKQSNRFVVIEGSESEYSVPTKKDLLVFEKEKSFHRHSENKQLKRLANEISDIDQD